MASANIKFIKSLRKAVTRKSCQGTVAAVSKNNEITVDSVTGAAGASTGILNGRGAGKPPGPGQSAFEP